MRILAERTDVEHRQVERADLFERQIVGNSVAWKVRLECFYDDFLVRHGAVAQVRNVGEELLEAELIVGLRLVDSVFHRLEQRFFLRRASFHEHVRIVRL